MTWNASNLTRGSKELALLNLLRDNSIDVAVVTETEVPEAHGAFDVSGYVSFLPLIGTGGKFRVIVYVRADVATASNARLNVGNMSTEQQTVWLCLDRQPPRLGRREIGAMVIGGTYRQWRSDTGNSGMTMERTHMESFLEQVKAAAEAHKSVLVLGDLNLDSHRGEDPCYGRSDLLRQLQNGMNTAGYKYHTSLPTYRSHGSFIVRPLPPQPLSVTSALWGAASTVAATLTGMRAAPAARAARLACLDHVYSAGLNVDVSVLEDSSTDHFPVIATIRACDNGEDCKPALKQILRRDFKRIKSADLCQELEKCRWEEIYCIRDADAALEFIMRAIHAALDVVAPAKMITVKTNDDLYLSRETREMMKARDEAGRDKYKFLRNRATAMVRRDRLRSNMAKLAKAKGDSRTVWQIAKSATGQCRMALPSSLFDVDRDVMTSGDAEAASLLNRYYITKVEKLKSKVKGAPPPPPSAWPVRTSTFAWKYMNAGRVKKLINGLGSTEALGPDMVPVSVYKRGVEVLCGPIAHMINQSLATGVFPEAFKHGIVVPVFKGQGKDRKDPASYRPVSLLCALSKVLELAVKSSLQQHLDVSGNLPTSQHGFRSGRSCTSAIAAAHAAWVRGQKSGRVVGVLAFDLSAAFDLVSAQDLLPKLKAVGVQANARRWFASYLAGGHQRVSWNTEMSEELEVCHGVRQGSILGPLLFLLHVADMPEALGVQEDGGVFYADDSSVWVVGNTVATVTAGLQAKAALFTEYVEGNGLVLNSAKTQLLFSRGAKVDNVYVNVNGSAIKPTGTLSLLGVTFDRAFTTAPHDSAVEMATKQRAGVVARLAHHVPRGPYLRQLAHGLVFGKLSHAAAAVVTPRTSDVHANAAYSAVQVHVNNVARTLIGAKKSEHRRVEDILDRAKFPSVNELVVRAVATETWKAHRSLDGNNGERNPLGKLMFGPVSDVSADVRPTRSVASGIVPIALRGESTFITHGAELWNSSKSLREAKTLSEVKKLATALAKLAPIK
jgi:exonuclease III